MTRQARQDLFGLIACPFCGNSEISEYEELMNKKSGPVRASKSEYMYCQVICSWCGASGPDGISEIEANELWNQRVKE